MDIRQFGMVSCFQLTRSENKTERVKSTHYNADIKHKGRICHFYNMSNMQIFFIKYFQYK